MKIVAVGAVEEAEEVVVEVERLTLETNQLKKRRKRIRQLYPIKTSVHLCSPTYKNILRLVIILANTISITQNPRRPKFIYSPKPNL